MRAVLFATLLLLVPAAIAQESGLAYLAIGPDAHGMAIGDAGAATVAGPFAAERNPAGLATGRGAGVGLTHHRWVAGVSTYGLAARFEAGRSGGFGLYMRATGAGDLDARDRPGPPVGTFDVQFVAAGAGLARQFGPLRIGIAAKYLSERIFSVSSTGYAVDMGMQAGFARDAVLLGLVWQHLGSMSELGNRATELPRTVRGGVAVRPFRVLAFDDGFVLVDATLTLEASHNTVDDETRLHFGLAAEVVETLEVAVGYVTNDALRGMSFGAAMEYGDFRLEYALVPFEAGFGGPGHLFTLVYLR